MTKTLICECCQAQAEKLFPVTKSLLTCGINHNKNLKVCKGCRDFKTYLHKEC